MKSIEQDKVNELIIKKSKFITYIYKINNKENIETYLRIINNQYRDATHVCYAYIIKDEYKYYDDSEPSKTAGFPILNILQKKKLTNVLCIVVRYYGGTKLGASGLIRAYSNSCKEVINKCNIIPYIQLINISITFEYCYLKTIDKILKDVIITNKDFNNLITYDIKIDKENKQNYLKKLNNYIKKD